MSYSESCHISLGTGKTGITDLRAQLVTAAGVDTGSEISGAVELNDGDYLLEITEIPDDFIGGIKIYQDVAPTVIIASGAVNSPIPNIHNALDTWEPDTETSPPAVIVPPDNPDECRVYLWAKEQSPDDIPDELENATAQITDLPYTVSDQLFSGEAKAPVYSDETGLAYWDIVRGATVKIILLSHGLTPIEITVPDSETVNLSTLI